MDREGVRSKRLQEREEYLKRVAKQSIDSLQKRIDEAKRLHELANIPEKDLKNLEIDKMILKKALEHVKEHFQREERREMLTNPPRAKEAVAAPKVALPIRLHAEEILSMVESNQVVVVVGETGSGKTTQIPQLLLPRAAPKKLIGVTQPRRLAAISISKRVGAELGNPRLSCYSVRFDSNLNPDARIRFLTDGILLREFMNDPLLSKYSALMIDEVHERNVETDILLGLLKILLPFRKDLKLVISSATLNSDQFSKFFDSCPVLKVEGRLHEVSTTYIPPEPKRNYLEQMLLAIVQLNLQEPPGDVLAFLPGSSEIENLYRRLRDLEKDTKRLGAPPIVPLKLYGSLDPAEQSLIFEPVSEGRKVILSTNIAETSLTVPGIVYVIDSGFCKSKYFDPSSGTHRLVIERISRASAKQRKGRAGRISKGKCYRMYSKEIYRHYMKPDRAPQIAREDLASVVLLLKSIGINDILNFPYLTPPDRSALESSLEQLVSLGAINAKGKLTKRGRIMSEMPVSPQIARALIESARLGVLSEVTKICSVLSAGVQNFFSKDSWMPESPSEHLAFMKLYDEHNALPKRRRAQWARALGVSHKTLENAARIYKQLASISNKWLVVESRQEGERPEDLVLGSLITGFFLNIAKKSAFDSSYNTITGENAFLHPSSPIMRSHAKGGGDLPEWVIFNERVHTKTLYITCVSGVSRDLLDRYVPRFLRDRLERLGNNG